MSRSVTLDRNPGCSSTFWKESGRVLVMISSSSWDSRSFSSKVLPFEPKPKKWATAPPPLPPHVSHEVQDVLLVQPAPHPQLMDGGLPCDALLVHVLEELLAGPDA